MKECAFHEVPTLAPLHLLEKSEGGFCLPISVMPALLGGSVQVVQSPKQVNIGSSHLISFI